MKTYLPLLAALPLVGLAMHARSAPPAPAAAQIVPGGELMHELVAVYDVTGFTLAGELNINLEVYNDGTAKVSRVSGFFGQPTVDAQIANVGAGTALAFANELRAQGAWQLGDQQLQVSDVPLQTLTVLRGFTDQKAHAFSYWLASDEYAGVGTVIQKFLDTHFPNF